MLGSLPAIEVRTPWWQDIEPLLEAARDAYGIEVVVLRMLDSELERPHGGRVTYLVETGARLPPAAADALLPWAGALDEQPLPALLGAPRRTRRRPGVGGGGAPGAPDRDADPRCRCARGTCRRSGACRLRTRDRRGSRSSRRSSATKATCCAASRRPRAAAAGHDGDRVLLADVEGEDQYDAAEPELLEKMVSTCPGRPPGGLDRPGRRPQGDRPARLARAGADGTPSRTLVGSALPPSCAHPRTGRRSKAFVDGLPARSSPRSAHAGSRTRSSTATTTRATCAGPPDG